VTEGWRELRNGEVLLPKYNWNDQIEEDEMDRTCNMNGENRKAYRILAGKPEEKKPD
jgi:hypothetical protein